MSAWFLRNYLKDADLAAITTAVSMAERNTDGEIRVCIRHRRHWKERKLSLHEIAVGEFQRLGMHNTATHAGVLILLLFSERKFHIIGDSGIHAKVGDQTWEHIAHSMGLHFKQGKFRDGIIHGVEQVGEKIATYFPKTEGDVNQLADDVVVD